MVYGTVEQSGGLIKVTSAPGEGTTIQIWLPLVAEDEEAPEELARKVRKVLEAMPG
jgi:light-regulated signal transduction histidine kinase (bacteriophytochrome)